MRTEKNVIQLNLNRESWDSKQKFTHFSLFSGAGGLDCGIQLAEKFRILLANDKLEIATKTYVKNFETKLLVGTPRQIELPAVFNGDIADLDFDVFTGLKVDVITGGPPCQDFSVIRGPQEERQGIYVSRGKLYSYFVKALAHLQPKIFLFENVPGLKSANEGEAYKTILDDFSTMKGWKAIRQIIGNTSDVTPQSYAIIFNGVANASRMGVPQARRRLLVIGVRKDIARSFQGNVKALRNRLERIIKGQEKAVGKYPLTPLEVFEGKSLPDLQNKYCKIMREYEGVDEEVDSSRAHEWKKNVWDKLTFNIIEDYLLVNGIEPKNEKEIDEAFKEHIEILMELGYLGKNVMDLKCSDKTCEVPNERESVLDRMSKIPPFENHEFVRGTDWEVEGRGISLIYRRIHPLKPAYTIVAYGGGGTWGYHYDKNRSKLTSRERARLQTFPDNFIFEGNLSEIRAQIGEAVPPLMMKNIAQGLANFLTEVS